MTEKDIKASLIIAAILVFALGIYFNKPSDPRTLSKSGSMQVLKEKGTITFSEGVLIYDKYPNVTGTGVSRIELKALVSLSNDSTYIFIRQ